MDISILLRSDGYIFYNKVLAKVLGPGEAIMIGLFCSKYNYYKQRGELLNVNGKEYFFCVQSWIENETGLTADRQRAIIQSLQVRKILEVKKIGMPAKNYYGLNFEELCKCFENPMTQWSGNPTTSGPEIQPQVVGKSDLNNNKTLIPKGITSNNKNKNEYIVEEASTSHISTENSNKNESKTLEDFRKKYTTNELDIEFTPNASQVAEVIEHLNSVAGKNFRASTPETRKMIAARLKDGYTVDEMKKVIDHRWEMWKGTDMEQYMRPNTLFRPSKFENYLNAIGTKRKMGNRGCSDTLAIHGAKHEEGSAEQKTLAGRKF